MEQPGEWISLDEAAMALTVGTTTVEELIDHGLIEARQQGDSTVVSHASLLTYIKESQRSLLSDSAEE